jgi:hypothetical protein
MYERIWELRVKLSHAIGKAKRMSQDGDLKKEIQLNRCHI